VKGKEVKTLESSNPIFVIKKKPGEIYD